MMENLIKFKCVKFFMKNLFLMLFTCHCNYSLIETINLSQKWVKRDSLHEATRSHSFNSIILILHLKGTV